MPKTLALLIAFSGIVWGSTLHGLVTDHSGAMVAGAAVTLESADGSVSRTKPADTDGSFLIDSVPAGVYRLTVEAAGFERRQQMVTLRTAEIAEAAVSLNVQAASTQVDVSDALAPSVELATAASQTIDKNRILQVPVLNPATGFSELITQTTPGVAADGNGFAHPLGEHADTSVSIDGQPITDQQAKIFSNQMSTDVVQTMDVVTGAPPAEFGGKTSLLVDVTTKSGLNKTKAFGSLSSLYGSFGSWSESLTYGAGSAHWGNFFAGNVSGSGRFLDTPEFSPLHARGNAESLFDRVDWNPGERDELHLNLTAARSWFQTPNTYDAQAAGQDQRSQIRSFNIAPGWTRTVNERLLLTVRPFLRFDRSQYFPSADRSRDLPATLSQSRYLTNAGVRTDLAYSRGIHNGKAGGSYWRTPLREDFSIGLTDPNYNVPGSPDYLPGLLPYDLSRGGRPYAFRGRATVVESALYAQDAIRFGRLSLTLGLRYDRYNGLSTGNQLQPRFGIAYRTPWSNTVVRVSYARLFETPYNENLIVASEASRAGGENPFGTFRSVSPRPGTRNQFNAGLAQQFGSHVSVDADAFWKYTENAFDFDSLFLTPITFPIGWRKSKIDGLAARAVLKEFHGFTAHIVMGHTRSRFFGPQTGGVIFNSTPDGGVFRIDHSEEYQHTANIRYQRGRRAPWLSFTWRYNSGLALAGVVPDYASALELTANEQAQMGLYCGSLYASLGNPIRSCASPVFGATRVSIPPPGTHNDDLRPTRVSPRHVFDFGVGHDDLIHTERYKVAARLTVLNAANRQALYNFLSTFSGTHFLQPRTVQAELRLSF